MACGVRRFCLSFLVGALLASAGAIVSVSLPAPYGSTRAEALGSTVSASATEGLSEATDSASALELARSSEERVEDPSQRDAMSSTFANPDGTWTTEVSPVPVNYRDDQGRWQPIDNRLVATGRPGFAAENAANGFRLLVPSDVGAAPVRLEDDRGGWMSFRLKGAQGPPEVRGNSADVPDGPGSSEVTYDSMPWGVKETITLDSAPSSAPVYSFDLRLATGLSPVVTEDNEVLVTDAEGAERFRVRAPFMEDSSGTVEGISTAVPVVLTRVGANWRLTLAPDFGWLSDPARVYPVLVDPTTEVEPADGTPVNAKDTFLAEDQPNTAFGSANWLRVGGDANGNRRRSLLRFPLSGEIPTQATVESATLKLYVDDKRTNTSVELSARAMRGTSETGGTSWAEDATWNGSGTGTNPWNGASGYARSTDESLKNFGGGAVDEYKAWGVTDIVTRWVATPSTNNGFLLWTAEQPAPNELRFASGEDSAAQRPILAVDWKTAPPAVEADSLTVSPDLAAGPEVVTRSLTPQLSATGSDPDSFEMSYAFEVLDAAGQPVPGSLSEGTVANPTPGTPLSFSAPAGALADGAYTARVQVGDETAPITPDGTWTELPFVVDQAPATPTDLAVSPATQTSPWVTSVVDPEFSATLTDPGTSDSVTGVFEVRRQGETAVVTGEDEVASGQRAVFALSEDEALTPGAAYEFRVGSQDPVAQSQEPPVTEWSGWVSFTVTPDASIATPLQLAEPLTVWDNGPDLTWTPYREDPDVEGDELVQYQIFRACQTLPAGGCPNPVTSYAALKDNVDPIATLDPGTTEFSDRTAPGLQQH